MMSCPDNLSKHDAHLWDLAMRWPVRAGATWMGFTAIEDTRAHGCPMCTDGLRHTFYLHYAIVGYLLLLDRVFKPLVCLYNAYLAVRRIVLPILYRTPGYLARIEKRRKQRRDQCQEEQRGARR
jgi:hypothetical protein